MSELFLWSLALVPSLIFSQLLKGAPNADLKSSFSVQLPPLWYPGLQLLASSSLPKSDLRPLSSARLYALLGLHLPTPQSEKYLQAED